ncbi:MAG: hypothetical protein WD825_03630 [Gemmatimonadaceae bacterium]
MTCIAIKPEIGFATVSRTTDRGISSEADELRRLISSALEFRGNITIGERHRVALQMLREAYEFARYDGWDGARSIGVEASTVEYAKEFLSFLPLDVPVPDVSVDADGEVAFEWYRSSREVFSVSVGRDGTLTYAGLFGRNRRHGSEQPSETIPPSIAFFLDEKRTRASA